MTRSTLRAAAPPGNGAYVVWGSLAICALGVAAILAATAQGLGITPDSTVYISVARRALRWFGVASVEGASVARLSAEVPPGYPMTLAVVSLVFRQDPVQSARWLAAAFVAANLAALGVLLRRSVPGRPAYGLLGPALALGVHDFLVVHTNAWTEPLFLLLLTLAFLAVERYLRTGRPAPLMTATAIGAAAGLTRFSGPALVVAAAAVIALEGQGSIRRRLASAGVMGAALVPMLLWSLFMPRYRDPAWHPPSGDYFLLGWDALSSWVVPAVVPLAVVWRRTAAAVVVGLLLLAPAARPAGLRLAADDGAPLRRCLWLFAWCYLLLLVITRAFWDAINQLDGRLLSPLVVPAVVLGIARIDGLRASLGRWPAVRALGAVLVLGWAVAAGVTSAGWIAHVHERGQGYGSRFWRESPTLAALRAIPTETLLVSNGNDAVAAVTGRRGLRVPDKVNPATLEPNPAYASDMAAIYRRMRSGGFVVYLDVVGRERPYMPDETDMLAAWDLALVVDTADGAIYRARQQADAKAEIK